MSVDIASALAANTAIEYRESPGYKFSSDQIRPVPHHIVTTLGRFLQYCRPPFNEFDFLEVAHHIKSAACPDDPARNEAFQMGEYNRLLQTLTEYVERNTPA